MSPLKHTSQIENRSSLPALPKLLGVGRFLNHHGPNVEQGLTNVDFRMFKKMRSVETAQKNFCASI